MTPDSATQQFIIRAVVLTFCGCMVGTLAALIGVVVIRDGASAAQIMQSLIEIVWALIAGLGGVIGVHVLRGGGASGAGNQPPAPANAPNGPANAPIAVPATVTSPAPAAGA